MLTSCELASDRQKALSLLSVSRETEERFDVYVQLLLRWGQKFDLISEATFATVWTRHLIDSAQIHVVSPHTNCWVDIGTGAGFPGIVLAMQLACAGGGVVHCVERDQRKCAFLREVARATCAPAVVHSIPIQLLSFSEFGAVNGVTARAVASLSETLALADDCLIAGALGVFPCGRRLSGKIRSERYERRRFRVESIPNLLDVSASILRLRLD